MDFAVAYTATREAPPYMLGGVVWTAGLIVGAMLLGLALGVPLAVLHVYGPWPVRRAERAPDQAALCARSRDEAEIETARERLAAWASRV